MKRLSFLSKFCFVLWFMSFHIIWNDVSAKKIQLNNYIQCFHEDTVINRQQTNNTSEEKVWVIVEEMPIFGEKIPQKKKQQNKISFELFQKYLSEHVVYPANAPQRDEVVKIYVSFFVDEQGDVVDVNVVRGDDQTFDAEAVRVVSSSPRWTPGRHRGEVVKVRITVIVEFKK